MPSSLYGDGTDGWVDVGSVTSADGLSLYNSAGTILAWVKPQFSPSTDGSQRVIGKETGANGAGGWSVFINADGYFSAAVNGTTYTTSLDNAACHVNVWQPIAVAWDASNIYLYQWGELMFSTTLSGGLPPNTTASVRLFGATWSTERQYIGYMRDVSVHSALLTQTQILDWIYEQTVPQTNLEAHWLLEDGSGTTATDQTGNWNGTLDEATVPLTWDADYPWQLDDFPDLDTAPTVDDSYLMLLWVG